MGLQNLLSAWEKKLKKQLQKERKKHTSWEYLSKIQNKQSAQIRKEQRNKRLFENSETAFEYWFKRYENYSKWLRNRLILKGMRNSRFAQWGRFTEAQILEKITNIDKARVIAQKHEFLDSFEYSFTFTYDNAKNTEKNFQKRIVKVFTAIRTQARVAICRNMATRKE